MPANSHSRTLPLTMLFAVAAVLAPAHSAIAAEPVEAFVACSSSVETPASVCHSEDIPAAILKSASEIEYDVCFNRPGFTRCEEHQHASAGKPAVNSIGRQAPGEYSVTWKISGGGPEIAFWQYLIEDPPGILHSGGASSVFERDTRRQLAGAFFPKRQTDSCPRVYVRPVGRVGVCFFEYRLGGLWHLRRGTTNIPPHINNVVTNVVSDRAWRRHVVRCPLPGRIPGSLESNNACGRAMPDSDAALVVGQLLPNIRSRHALGEIVWKSVFGPGVLARFEGEMVSGSYRFSNGVGDWFQYNP